jgi:hypothetical protein
MNGSTARLEAVRQIFYKCAIQSVIETGTFRGTTTEWFAQLGVPVVTIESHPATFEFAIRRLRRFDNVTVLPGSSTDVLPRYFGTLADRSAPTMIYLDSHWEGHLPLAEELEIICRSLDRFVIIVDDFEVPGDPYSFDNYGPGKALTAEYLDRCAGRDLARFYPSVPSKEETGTRRGWIVLTKDLDFIKILSMIGLLRPSV